MPTKLLAALRAALAAAGDPARAAQMQAYMKSALPYHGVPMPVARRIFREVLAGAALPDAASWQREVRGLWRGARFREERYAAIELTGDRRARAFQTLEALPLYEELIVTGAWWDLVDTLAAHRIGELLEHHPREMRAVLLDWSRGDDLWKRRSAILAQLRFKAATDRELLYACIEPSLPSTEFFLRKAIGWALREYAKTDAAEIRRYVRAHESVLSGLSRREALKRS